MYSNTNNHVTTHNYHQVIHDLIELDAYRLCNVQPAPEHIHFDRLLRILMLTRKFCLCSLLTHFYTNMNEICVLFG